MKRLAGLSVAGLVLSGCVSTNGLELPETTPRTFVSFPYSSGPEIVCRTPVPRPSLGVVSRTVWSLAGPEGTVRQVPIPAGAAFGIWTSKRRIAAIGGYLESLSREKTVNVEVSLRRVNKKTPYLVRAFPVRTNQPFVAATWTDGRETRALSAFFVKAGQTVSPVLDLVRLAPGFRSCRTATPDFPGNDIVFNPDRAIVKSGTTNLEITWEISDGRR
jgi:hypothetical protein